MAIFLVRSIKRVVFQEARYHGEPKIVDVIVDVNACREAGKSNATAVDKQLCQDFCLVRSCDCQTDQRGMRFRARC